MELRERDKQVLRLLFAETAYSEEALPVIWDGLDIDREKTDFLLPLALLGIRHNWACFPASLKPRLEGIYQAARLRNMYGIPWLKEQLEYLLAAGIPTMFVKGMAMRSCYATDIPRVMSDFDVAVPAERFEEAAAILTEHADPGWIGPVSPHARHIGTLQKTIDLHQLIFKTNRKATALVWNNCLPVSYQGLKISVPDPVDMFIHIVESKARDEIIGNQEDRQLKWLFDTRVLLDHIESSRWKRIADRAGELGVSYYLVRLMPVFSEVFPDQLTAEELGLFFPQDEAFQKRHAQIARYERIRKKHQEALAERKSGGSVVPRFFDSIRHPWSKYFDYIKPDRVAGGVDSSFIQFLYETYHVKNGMQLFALFAKRVFKRPE